MHAREECTVDSSRRSEKESLPEMVTIRDRRSHRISYYTRRFIMADIDKEKIEESMDDSVFSMYSEWIESGYADAGERKKSTCSCWIMHREIQSEALEQNVRS